MRSIRRQERLPIRRRSTPLSSPASASTRRAAIAAQIANLSPDVRAKIAEMGPVLTPDLVRTTMDMCKPPAAAKPLDGIKIDADVSYGPDARNKLDLYQMQRKAAAPAVRRYRLPRGGP